MDFKEGVHIDGTATETNALAGTLRFKNNVIAGCVTKYVSRVTNPSFNAGAWFLANNNDTVVSTSGLLMNPYSYLTGDYRPMHASIVASGADFTDTNLIGTLSTNEDQLDVTYEIYDWYGNLVYIGKHIPYEKLKGLYVIKYSGKLEKVFVY
jgi:hypothetical protein